MTFQVKQFCRLTPSGVFLFAYFTDNLKRKISSLTYLETNHFQKFISRHEKNHCQVLVTKWKTTLFYIILHWQFTLEVQFKKRSIYFTITLGNFYILNWYIVIPQQRHAVSFGHTLRPVLKLDLCFFFFFKILTLIDEFINSFQWSRWPEDFQNWFKDEMESNWIFKKSGLLFPIKFLLNYSAVRDGMGLSLNYSFR